MARRLVLRAYLIILYIKAGLVCLSKLNPCDLIMKIMGLVYKTFNVLKASKEPS